MFHFYELLDIIIIVATHLHNCRNLLKGVNMTLSRNISGGKKSPPWLQVVAIPATKGTARLCNALINLTKLAPAVL